MTPCVYTQNTHFLWAFSLGPKKAGFVQPVLILWPYGSFPAMGTNGDQCRLLLFEDPALEAQPQHEVVVVRPSACFAEDLLRPLHPCHFVHSKVYEKPH